jgi:hypothetical protein
MIAIVSAKTGGTIKLANKMKLVNRGTAFRNIITGASDLKVAFVQ